MDTKANLFGVKFWIISASIVIVIAGMKAAANIVTPLFLALFIATICIGPFIWLNERGVPEWLSIIIIILLIVFISISVLLFIGSAIPGFVDRAPFYGQKLSLYWENVNRWLVQKTGEDSILFQSINPKNVMTLAGKLFSGIGDLMSNLVIVLLIVLFLLLEMSLINKKIIVIKPESIASINNIIRNIRKYFGTKTITSLATGIFVTIGLALIGVDFPILWGFLAFVLNYIPNIGSIIAAIPAVLLALVQIGPGSALATIIIYLLVNTIIGNVVEPKMMGKNLGLSTLVIFISLIFWGWVLGTVGMLLAVPLTITVKLVLDEINETKWLGILLGDETSLNNLKKLEEDNFTAPGIKDPNISQKD